MCVCWRGTVEKVQVGYVKREGKSACSCCGTCVNWGRVGGVRRVGIPRNAFCCISSYSDTVYPCHTATQILPRCLCQSKAMHQQIKWRWLGKTLSLLSFMPWSEWTTYFLHNIPNVNAALQTWNMTDAHRQLRIAAQVVMVPNSHPCKLYSSSTVSAHIRTPHLTRATGTSNQYKISHV